MKYSDTWIVYDIRVGGEIGQGLACLWVGTGLFSLGFDGKPILFIFAFILIPFGLISLFSSESYTLVASKRRRTLTISSEFVFAGISMPSYSHIQVIPFSDIESIGFRKWSRTVDVTWQISEPVRKVEGTETDRYIEVNTKDKCFKLCEGFPRRYVDNELKKWAESLREYIGVTGIDTEIDLSERR